ncbi:uncharacterized protein DC041_0010390, partial [Schistosoma bovis]
FLAPLFCFGYCFYAVFSFIYLFVSYWIFLIIATIVYLFINTLQKNRITTLFLIFVNYFTDLCGYDVYSLVFIYFLAKLSPIIFLH